MPKETTLTLDDDVADRLDQQSRRSGAPLNDVANDALRKGLPESAEPRPMKKFVVRPLLTGPILIDITCTSRALEELDRLEAEERERQSS
jgi:hypothetical protein